MRVHIVEDVRRRHPLRKLDFLLTRQYWYPVVLAKKNLASRGIDVHFFEKDEGAALDCDALVISSRQHDHLHNIGLDPKPRVRALEKLVSANRKLIWFDLRDSSGTPQFEVLPLVDLYAKQFLLKDMALYRNNFYGGRIFSDYYHRNFNVTDDAASRSDENLFAPLDMSMAKKVVVGWDLSYDYRRSSAALIGQAVNIVEEGWRLLNDAPAILDFHDPNAPRAFDLSAMFSVGRYRSSVAYQRRAALEKVGSLKGSVLARKVPRAEFVAAMRNSKIILSCFGNGEVCYREHEAWTAGAAVIMPSMNHVRTWPDRYQDGETYRAIDWDLEKLPEAFEELMQDEALRKRLAVNGQNVMRQIFSEAGLEKFAARFESLVSGADPDLSEDYPREKSGNFA